MVLECIPLKEIIIDKIRLPFGITRELARAKLGGVYEEQNEEILLEGTTQPIIQRRDLYNQVESSDFFFLHYDQDDQLTELEVHHCKRIKLFDIEFNFTDEAELIASELSHHAAVTQELTGHWHFPALHVYLMDEKYMGGEDSSLLGYFACSAAGRDCQGGTGDLIYSVVY